MKRRYFTKYFSSLEEACNWLNTVQTPVEVISTTHVSASFGPGGHREGFAMILRG